MTASPNELRPGPQRPSKRLVVVESALAGILGTVGAKVGSRLLENEILGAVVGGIAAGLTSLVVLRLARRRRPPAPDS